MSDQFCVILATAGNPGEADRLAELLVSSKLAACVQVTDIRSCYAWKGKTLKEPEQLLLIKTASHLYPRVEKMILENHSYEVPEIVQIPIAQGFDRYLGWISENTGGEA